MDFARSLQLKPLFPAANLLFLLARPIGIKQHRCEKAESGNDADNNNYCIGGHAVLPLTFERLGYAALEVRILIWVKKWEPTKPHGAEELIGKNERRQFSRSESHNLGHSPNVARKGRPLRWEVRRPRLQPGALPLDSWGRDQKCHPPARRWEFEGCCRLCIRIQVSIKRDFGRYPGQMRVGEMIYSRCSV